MKKLLLLVLASLAFTSACAGPRVHTKQDQLLNRCNDRGDSVDGSGRPTGDSCRDSNG